MKRETGSTDTVTPQYSRPPRCACCDGTIELSANQDIALGLNALMYGMTVQYLPGDEDLPEDGLEQMALAMMTGMREWTLEGRKPRSRRRTRR